MCLTALKAIQTAYRNQKKRVFEGADFLSQLAETLWLDTPGQTRRLWTVGSTRSWARQLRRRGGPKQPYETVKAILNRLPPHRREALGCEKTTWASCVVMQKHRSDEEVKHGDVEKNALQWRLSKAMHARVRLRPSGNLCVRPHFAPFPCGAVLPGPRVSVQASLSAGQALAGFGRRAHSRSRSSGAGAASTEA